MICRKCYARLHPRATNCRKKKFGHLQHQTQEEVEVICTFFFREIIFHENFRVNATIKVEDSLCQKILRKCLNLFLGD